MNNISTALRRLGACPEGADWADTQPDASTAWDRCERADWMLWLLGRVAGSRDTPSRLALVECCADCAETAVQLIRAKEIRDQVRHGLALLRRYVRGEGDLYSARRALDAAAYASAAYASAAYASAAADAAYASAAYASAAFAAFAADAADAAWAAANAAANAAAYAAFAAFAAAAADDAAADRSAANAAADAARSRALKEMSAIVRRHYPTPPRLGCNEEKED